MVGTETKKIILVGIVATLLLLTILSMSTSQPESGTRVSVEPSTKTRYLDNAFRMNVTLWNVTDLWSFQLNITWSNVILNCTGDNIDETAATIWGVDQYGIVPLTMEKRINNTLGMYIVGATALYETTPTFTGNATLVTLNFTAIGVGQTKINISRSGLLPTTLVNSTYGEIPYTEYNSTVNIRIPGDINGDGIVDAKDLQELGKAYNSIPGNSNWNELADINNDSDVDQDDLETISENYGNKG